MARALASGHDPSSRIGAARGGFKPTPCLRPFALRLHRCRQCVVQPSDLVLERRPLPASAPPPFRSLRPIPPRQDVHPLVSPVLASRPLGPSPVPGFTAL